MLKKFKEGLSKNVIILGIVSGLTDISSEMLYPIIPIFLSSVLNAPMTALGLIEGIAESTASILKIFSGYISDKIRRRKPLIVLGYGLSALSKPLMALAFSWTFVLFARFIDRVGKGIRTSPRDALIASSTPKQHWGKAFGFHRTMDTFGAAIGPLITLLLLHYFGENDQDYRKIFIIAFIPAIIGFFILIRYITDNYYQSETRNDLKKQNFFNLSLDFKIFLIISFVFFIAKFSDAFLIMKAKNIGLSTSKIIWIYFTYNILYTFFSTPAGMFSDRVGKVKTFLVGFFVYSVVCLGFSNATKEYQIWVLFAVYSIYGALSEGISKAIVSSLTNEENRATALGLYHGIVGFSLLLSSTVAGILWEKISPDFPFYFSATVSIISAVSMFVWVKLRSINI